MAIKFYNVKTKETRSADTEPMISAFWASSDLGPNARVGQDMGWRLAPEVVVRIRKIKQDEELMQRIAASYQIPRENLTDTDLLFHVSQEDARKNQQQVDEEDHTEEYEKEIAELSEKEKVNPNKIGETASEEVERVSRDDRSDLEKASGSVNESDDKSVTIPKATIKAEEKKHDEVEAMQESSQQHEEGSINDGTAAHEEGDSLDDILGDAKEEAAENAHLDAENQTPAPQTGTLDPEQEGREQAEENTGEELPGPVEGEGEAPGGEVDQNADQVEEQAEELHENADEEKADESESSDEDDDTEVSEAYSRSRKELEKLATSRGVENPSSYANKDELAEAIKKVGKQ